MACDLLRVSQLVRKASTHHHQSPTQGTANNDIETFHDFHPKLFCSTTPSRKHAHVLTGTHTGMPSMKPPSI